MSEPINEQISALVDGELPPEETTLLMRRLAREPELAARLARYRLVGGVLRGEGAVASRDFAARVSAAVALEPGPTLPVREPPPARRAVRVGRFARPLVGLSVAASVGVLAVWVLGRTETPVEVAAVAPATPVTHGAAMAVVAAATPLMPRNAEPLSYVTPAATPARIGEIPGATLANYVAAHSGVSTPLGGREVLIHLVADPDSRGAAQP